MNRRHEKSNTNAIRELNDVLRTTFVGGAVMITAGVAALEAGTRGRLLQAIRRFDGFSATDDPYGEHDFGAVELDGQTYFFKIDYYDPSLEGHSPDAADPRVTTRIMTVMCADEY